MKRPPSLDYKPRRSESEAPTGMVTSIQTVHPNGTTVSTTVYKVHWPVSSVSGA